jgi:hypothetical protein
LLAAVFVAVAPAAGVCALAGSNGVNAPSAEAPPIHCMTARRF